MRAPKKSRKTSISCVELALRWGVPQSAVVRWRTEQGGSGRTMIAEIERIEAEGKQLRPNLMLNCISTSALIKRWDTTVHQLAEWRKTQPVLGRAVWGVGDKRGGKYYLLANIDQAEAAGEIAESRQDPAVKPKVIIDGVSCLLAVAVNRYARLTGMKRQSIRERLYKSPDCTSEWLTRPYRERSQGRVDTPPPAELIVDGTPMVLARAANYIARRSRHPIVISRVGHRISLRLAPGTPTPADIGTFHRATPAMVAEDLAA